MIKSEANGPLNGPGLARIGNESTHVSHVSHVSLSPPDSTDCFPWFRAICYLLSAICYLLSAICYLLSPPKLRGGAKKKITVTPVRATPEIEINRQTAGTPDGRSYLTTLKLPAIVQKNFDTSISSIAARLQPAG